ncbi:MAG: type IV pilus twitching motility protein PilT [Candidatus Melainabacteria bacterium]|nr:type IV pilus twitching motility protein PilT [Candidatus Melainabacteria bacterium]
MPQDIELPEIVQLVLDRGASDLHLKPGQPPIIRVSGALIRTPLPELQKGDVEELVFPYLSDDQKKHLAETCELDFSFGIEGLGRFRANIYKDRGAIAAAFRVINTQIPAILDLGLPEICIELTNRPRGLVLVTGPTGSGKSTSLASMIDHINMNQSQHILTVEDPIEFLHRDKKSVISQRELGTDTRSFTNALRAALREDPDVILVGEMRDLETIHLALTASETGHLVFSTVHTSSAAQSLDRIIDAFPSDQQAQIRVMLSTSLLAIVSQTLIPRQEETQGGSPVTKGRVIACEVLINTPAVANLIREAKTEQLYSAMQMGAKQGMQTLEQSLARLVKQGIISEEEAMAKTSRQQELAQLIGSHATAGAGMQQPINSYSNQASPMNPPVERDKEREKKSLFGRL